MRQAVRRFAELMETQLKQNDHKGGWNVSSREWLWQRAFDELLELRDAIKAKPSSPIRIAREAADVANFAMMIADKEVPARVETL